MELIRKNILNIEKGLICQQVNCKGVMGAGLALSIRKKWPSVYDEYRQAFKEKNLNLGFVEFVSVDNGIYVVNLCAQDGYGRSRRYTNYKALRICLKTVARFSGALLLPCYIPYKMGCGLAGGDWNIVEKIIEEEIPNAIICRLGE